MLAHSSDIDSYFTLPTGAGECSGANTLNFLNEMLDDATTLIQGMVDAMDAATASATTEQAAKDKIVAQKLFTSFFGIAFDGNDVLAEDEDAWAIVQSAINNVNEFLETEAYTCAKLPPVLFCDNFGNEYEWNAQAKNAEGNPIEMSDGYQPSIQDLYSTAYMKSQSTVPYWIPGLDRYIFTEPGTDGVSFCGGDTSYIGWTVYGYQGETIPYTLADGSEEYEAYEASSEIVVICPTVLMGEAEDVELLANVPYTAPFTDTELSSILPLSSTFFHELFHMTTYWQGDDVGPDAEENSDYVKDFTYDLFKALDLAMGVLVVPPDESSSDAGSDADSGSDSGSTDVEYYSFEAAAQNAESYVFFAVSWWNYAKTWSEGDSAVFYTGCAESWDWLGPVTSCSSSDSDDES
ncbi:uncharacterized protein N7483_008784 [Penicillium malachiteum]|uniref:uncharacterized protein n=1 Tax=Penicillium malachiteum TaxID=1324776 RepID=UPI002548F4B7|nr:uncharacterized protein N7483_008784 [Penicillium malachiteum]KAJ5720850.1 hypothetical protein N7483_008784 [Penicillium malachiteum]